MKSRWIFAAMLAALMGGAASFVAQVVHAADEAPGAHHHDDEEGDHVASSGDLSVVHPWARAARAGADTLVFFELENEGETDVLEGATTDVAASVTTVGFAMADGKVSHVELGAVDIAHGDIDFDPHGMALRLAGLTRTLEKGDHFDLVLRFAKAGELELHVEVEAADATQHSHAGHSH